MQLDPRERLIVALDVASVAEAEALSPQLVVLGTHGKSALHEFFVGSVARSVATHCPISVLLVRSRPPKKSRGGKPARRSRGG